jgi:type VI secretion system protein
MFSDNNSATITLTVTLRAGSAPPQPMSATFDQQGGSIGRRQENDWVLPDPERFISGRHALVDFSDGAFYLTDISSNGVFLNRSTTPLGKDNRIALQDGDIISIGDYEISVTLPPVKVEVTPAKDLDSLDDPFALLVEQQAGQSLDQEPPTPSAGSEVSEPVYHLDEPEPSDLLIEQPSESMAQEPLSQADHTPDLNAFFNQPTPIPEDWDLEDESAAAKPSPVVIPDTSPEILPPSEEQPLSAYEPPSRPQEEPVPKPLAQESIPRPGPKVRASSGKITPQPVLDRSRSAPPPVGDEAGLRQALADGMGLSESYFEDLPMSDLLHNIGKVLRASVEGSMSILRARAQMKGEFRMTQTMIQPVENNPLKFSINTEDALRHIINPSPNSGYLPPLNAIEEAHEDIEAHMMAVMVGMQAALQVVLQRFKPEILEKRLGQSVLLEKLPLYRHAKTWDLFTELYSEIANEAEDDFHQLFGRTFSQAYEEQIRRLESLKHSDPNS